VVSPKRNREALFRGWLRTPISEFIERLRHPDPPLLDQLGVAA